MDPPSVLFKTAPEFWPFQTHQQQQEEEGNGSICGRASGFADMGGGGRDVSAEESSLTEQSGGGGGSRRRQRDFVVDGDSSKGLSTSGGNELTNRDTKHIKMAKSRDGFGDLKPEANSSLCSKLTDPNSQPSEAPKQDYIHVRARRGQATDSHSLAERARREKISERMKILQDLVPGCNKIIGKALVLDEIINYIQSLQRQVEFLSMKLEAVNSRMNSTIEGFPPKDFGFQAFNASSQAFSPQPPRQYMQESAPEWLHMQVGGGFERAT